MDTKITKENLQEFATKLHEKNKTIFAAKSLENAVGNLESTVAGIQAAVGSPLVASTAAEMTDTDKVYVYVGSETGYTAGNWYYYDGYAWTSGGVYNAVAIETDETLSIAGVAADARVTGDTIRNNIIKTDNVVFSGSDKFKPIWHVGALDGTTHEPNTAVSYRAYTGKFRTYGDRIIYSGIPAGVKLFAMFYNEDGTFNSWSNVWGGDGVLGINNCPYVALMARYDPEDATATMDVDDLAPIEVQNYAYVLQQIDGIKSDALSRNAYVDNQLELMNSVNVFRKAYTATATDVTYTATGNGYIKLNGSAAADRYFDIALLADMDIDKGEDYYLYYGCENDNISYVRIYFDTGGGLYNAYSMCTGMNKITIPANATQMLMRLFVKSGNSFSNKEYKLTLSKAKSNADLNQKSVQIRFLGAFGTGDCTLMKFEDGTTMAIDFGLDEAQMTLPNNWTRAVADLGITHLDYAVISHFHVDHVGMLLHGIDSLLDSDTTFFLPNGHAYTSAELAALGWIDTQANTTIVQDYTDVMDVITNNGCQVVYPAENSIYMIGKCPVQFFNSDDSWIMSEYLAHTNYDYNESSMCCYITVGSQRICFSGDIGDLALDRYKLTVLASQIFKVNHHCVGYNVIPLFMNSLMPDLCVTMIGQALAISRLGSSAMQAWCEDNYVPNVVTGINGNYNLSLYVNEGGYSWNNACRKLICSDEGI